MAYRTKTYIAGDWTGDKDLIDIIYKWNNSEHWGLHFIDAHEVTQARDSSLYCSIKKSLAERLNVSKKLVLIVGMNTASLRQGSCQYCGSYIKYKFRHLCRRGNHVDLRSYIEYECEKAVADKLKIAVIYNCSFIAKDRCPKAVRYIGNHLAAYQYENGNKILDYSSIKDAIMD